jgi:hypothetical protein
VGGGSHRNYFKLDGTGGETDLGRRCSRVEPRGPHNTKKNQFVLKNCFLHNIFLKKPSTLYHLKIIYVQFFLV